MVIVATRPVVTWEHSGAVSLSSFFCVPPYFVVPRKICFNDIINTIIFPPKNLFSPHGLNPGCGPGGN